MKNQTIQPGRAYTMRHTSSATQERAQIEAEVIALNNGDPDEARRRRNARIDLGEKQKQRLARMQRLGTDIGWIVRDLGGSRDPIVSMLKARQLSAGQAMAAINLRAYERGEAIASGGVAAVSEMRSGGPVRGMEAHVDRLTSGRMAKQRACEAVASEHWQAVYAVICGKALRQGCRLIGGDTTKALARLKHGVSEALDAAGAYMEIAA